MLARPQVRRALSHLVHEQSSGFSFGGVPGTDSGGNALFGNTPRADGTARGFPTYSEDMSLFKVFKLHEQLNMRFDAEFGNIFNRTDFCNPNTFWSPNSLSFGSIGTQCNQPRSIQFGLKFTY